MGALSQLFASAGDGVTLLNFTPEQMAKGDGGRELWTEYVIPAGTYAGQDADIVALSGQEGGQAAAGVAEAAGH